MGAHHARAERLGDEARLIRRRHRFKAALFCLQIGLVLGPWITFSTEEMLPAWQPLWLPQTLFGCLVSKSSRRGGDRMMQGSVFKPVELLGGCLSLTQWRWNSVTAPRRLSSDQAAREPTRVRSHQLSLRPGQPGSPGAAHRRLLAHADGARCHSNPNRSPQPNSPPCACIYSRLRGESPKPRHGSAAACPEAELFGGIARSLQLAGP